MSQDSHSTTLTPTTLCSSQDTRSYLFSSQKDYSLVKEMHNKVINIISKEHIMTIFHELISEPLMFEQKR